MTKRDSLLLVIVLLIPYLAGCSTDRQIIIDAGSNAYQCGDGATMFFGYLGRYYVEGNGCNGAGSKVDYAYEGTPEPPTIFRWKAVKFIPGKEGTAQSRRYFYAETYETIEIPPRTSDHKLYEVYLSLGPRLLFPPAIPDPAPPVTPIDAGNGVTVYRMGELDTLYYFVRSRPKTGRLPPVRKMPYHFHTIKGIEVSEAQYMTIACERSMTGQCDRYLKEDTPGLSEEQRFYLRAAREKAPMSQGKKPCHKKRKLCQP